MKIWNSVIGLKILLNTHILNFSSVSYLLPAATNMIHDHEESPEVKVSGTSFLSNGTIAISDPQYFRSLELDSNESKKRKFHNSTGLRTLGTFVTKRVS